MSSQNTPGTNSNPHVAVAREAEATLRLIANLPAPEGLEDRVLAGLLAVPPSGHDLRWPGENWLRTAAAAAIVFIILGGGWGIYSRVQPRSAVAAPPNVGTTGGFSNAGAVRVPQNVPSPVVALPAPVQSTEVKPAKKIEGNVASRRSPDAKDDVVTKATADSSLSVAK